jgi:hypothetical protein
MKPVETAVIRERLCKRHVSAATFEHATMEIPLGTVFSMRSAPTATSPNTRVTVKRSVSCGVGPEAIEGEPIGALSYFGDSGSAGRQSQEGGPGACVGGLGQGSTVLSRRLGSAVIERKGVRNSP